MLLLQWAFCYFAPFWCTKNRIKKSCPHIPSNLFLNTKLSQSVRVKYPVGFWFLPKDPIVQGSWSSSVLLLGSWHLAPLFLRKPTWQCPIHKTHYQTDFLNKTYKPDLFTSSQHCKCELVLASNPSILYPFSPLSRAPRATEVGWRSAPAVTGRLQCDNLDKWSLHCSHKDKRALVLSLAPTHI